MLPGGDFSSHDSLAAELTTEYPWLADALIHRYVRSYGTLCRAFYRAAQTPQIWAKILVPACISRSWIT
ncbi:hypothetical protein MBH78_21630 [Oceanimonas sp. NS1]|nr:hypothetical protein [Oceanimonas sp. NS1]